MSIAATPAGTSSGAPQRALGFWMCTALVVGNIIGMGIFLLPAGLAPYGFNATIGWVITLAGCLVLARVFARLARDFPRAEGPYIYMRDQFGEGAAFMTLWCYWVSLWITNATLAVGVVGYAVALVPGLAVVPTSLAAVGLVWLFVGISLLGARTGGGVQLATTALKLVPMAVVIGLGAWWLLTEPASYTRHLPITPVTLRDTMAASTIALFAMLGLESATVPAGRVHDPGRTIPRATLAGTLIAAVVYIIVSTIPMLLIPQAELAQSSAPFVTLLERQLGEGNGRWLALFVIISGLGALNGWTLLTGELTRTMATHGVLPKMFAHSNRHGAPVIALIVIGFLASAMALMGTSKSLVQGFVFLTTVVTAANLPLYLGCSLALVLLWRKRGLATAPGLLPLGLIGAAYSVFAIIGIGTESLLWAIALAAAGLPVYWAMRWRRARDAAGVPVAPA
jgi:APA family basic amino acid/polyamine antiporter